ncbi:MAG: type II secretion system F family protein [Planctomycetes bacterium]|nr:type II secretion system F family protein [Planctomycetota bacterium]
MSIPELRFINNLAVLLECGRPLRNSFRVMKDASLGTPKEKEAYEAMAKAVEKGEDFTLVLADFPELCSRSSLALLKAARRTSTLAAVLPRLAVLVRARHEGELDPRQRFFETWALMVETGFSIEEALQELCQEFSHGPLREVADGLRAANRSNKLLAEGAILFPEVFDPVSCDLLRYGEARDLAKALRAINRLI